MRIPSFAQEVANDRLFLDVPSDTFITTLDSLTRDSLKIPAYFIIPHSEKIYRNGFKLFRGIHYRFNPRDGKILFTHSLNPGDSLTAIFQKYPFPLLPEYSHRELKQIAVHDSSGGQEKTVTGLSPSRFFEEVDEYGSNLQRSGSIVRGVEIGSNRDLTLNSGLNLQLSGNITPDVQLVAALTDESTPLQPEGNTQTLQEVDKVFVKIKSPYLGGTLGDFDLRYQNSEYGNMQRKLQGITAQGQYNQYLQQITYATSRGTFHTNQFLGQEGNQGPYQLVGKNGEREIIVLAGTERVYVNGILQKRGENNEYVIDYSLGQITFTSNRLITSEDRIDVDFEYANNFQRYGKSLIGLSASRNVVDNGFGYDIRFFREWDDTKNLLEDSAPLTDEETAALARAGDDPFAASVSGVTDVGVGQGNYTRRDTVIDGKTLSYYKYAGTGQGQYSVRFSGVGRNNGSYVRERLGIYRFVGPGLGEYAPVKLVPLAGDKKLVDVGLNYRLAKHLSLNSEAAVSLFDRNVFSGIDDRDNDGQAYTLGAGYQNERLKLFGNSLGALQWIVNWKYRQARFSPLDREYLPEYNYKWDLSTQDVLNDEQFLESRMNYRPVNFMNLNFEGGLVERGPLTSSRRGRGQLLMSDSTILKSDVFGEVVNSKNGDQQSDWLRSGAYVGKKLWKSLPYLNFHLEDRQVSSTADSTLTGFYFIEEGGGLKLFSILGINWHLASQQRQDYVYNPQNRKERLHLSNSMTHRVNMNIFASEKWQGQVSFVYRDKNFTPFFERLPSDSIARYQPNPQFQDTTWRDRKSHLANLELQYTNADRTIDSRWDYKAGSELQALQEKVFLPVENNRGNYRFDEELQEYVPDPLGDYLLVIVPTGNYESVTNIEAGWQLRYRPKFTKQKHKGFSRFLHNISTLTYLRVDEKSREQNIWQLYLLNFEKYHNTATTLSGSYQINQDVYLFERNPAFGITLRSRYRDNLSNQYVDADYNEKRKIWDRSISWRQQLWGSKLSHEISFEQSLNTRSVSSSPSRNRDILGNTLDLVLNYRPVYAWQVRMGFEGGLQKDRAPANQLGVQFLQLNPQLNYSAKGKARGSASFTYLNVAITDNPFDMPLPFEMGKGKKEGDSFLWNLRFEYFISTHVTMTVNYNGRKDAGAEKTIHLGQAEVRAFF